MKNHQLEMFFKQKKIFLKKSNKLSIENNDIELLYNNKINNNIIEDRKNNMFNNNTKNQKNYLNNRLDIVNYTDSHSNDYNILNNFNFSLATHKKISPFNIINRYERTTCKEDNLRNRIRDDNENNLKFSLPNINIVNKEEKKSLSSNKKYCKIKLGKLSPRNNSHNSIKNYSPDSHNHYRDLKFNTTNHDNFRINLLSTNSKLSEILIPIISSSNTINNNEKDNININNNGFINNKKVEIFNGISDNKEENNKNNLNEILNLHTKNKVLKKIDKKLNLENNKNNLLININRSFISKLHKIKIEKGMNGNKIFEHLSTLENNLTNSKLPPINKLNDKNFI